MDIYPEVRRGLTNILNRYPGLSEGDAQRIQQGIDQLLELERTVAVTSRDISEETIIRFNNELSEIQLKLAGLESRLQ